MDKYIVRRTTDVDYRLEQPDGTVLRTWTQQSKPDIPGDVADEIVAYAENNNDTVGAVRMLLLGIAYRDSR